jgi:hypothetical protein
VKRDARLDLAHLYISRQVGQVWENHHFVGSYRAVSTKRSKVLSCGGRRRSLRDMPGNSLIFRLSAAYSTQRARRRVLMLRALGIKGRQY